MGKRKDEKKARKKRLEKEKIGLEKQEQKHLIKLKTEKGRLDTTPAYWKKEIEIFKKQKQEREAKLKRKSKE